MKIDRKQSLIEVQKVLDSIHFEHDEDEGAAEYYAELAHLKSTLEQGSDDEVLRVAEDLGQQHLLVAVQPDIIMSNRRL